MSDTDLEQVKRLAEQLSVEDRLQLWHHIAELPDSGIHSGSLDPPATIPENGKEMEGVTVSGNNFVVIYTDRAAALIQRDRTIFQVFFYPENYYKSQMEIRSWKDSPPPESIKQQIRAVFALHGLQEPTEEKIIEACKQSTIQIYEARTERMTNEISARLCHFVWLLFDAGAKIIEIGVNNSIAEYQQQRPSTLAEAEAMLEPYWQHIKQHLNIPQGGRRNIKHKWTVENRTCLSLHYERLKPIWQEAKRIAKEAQKSKEPTRQKRWREQVAAAYREENLPPDLIDQLATPRGGTPPADLAILHAARICIPEVSYSVKKLREAIKEWKFPAKNLTDPH